MARCARSAGGVVACGIADPLDLQELDDVSPQIQVLMARAMRDITYSPRLRLYDHPEALEMLHAAVPWFTTLLDTVRAAISHQLAWLEPP